MTPAVRGLRHSYGSRDIANTHRELRRMSPDERMSKLTPACSLEHPHVLSLVLSVAIFGSNLVNIHTFAISLDTNLHAAKAMTSREVALVLYLCSTLL